MFIGGLSWQTAPVRVDWALGLCSNKKRLTESHNQKIEIYMQNECNAYVPIFMMALPLASGLCIFPLNPSPIHILLPSHTHSQPLYWHH
ncbi:unnamed protein product, partial [Medioppia subpectinata]